MLRTGILLATLIVTAVSIGLMGRILGESNAKTGILTLRFNSTDILPGSPFLKSRTVQNRGIFQEIQSKVNSVKNAVATGLPGAVAASSQDIKKYIPKNCSLGTREFCVGYSHNITCKRLPLNFLDLVPDILQSLPDGVQVLPDTLEKPLQDKVKEFQEELQESLQPLERTLTKVTVPYIQSCLVTGSVLMVIIALLLACAFLSGLFTIVSILQRLVVGLRVVIVLGLICCILFSLPTVILGLFQANTKKLPSWIEVEKGEVGGLCIGALCCAVIMTLLTAVTATIN